MHAEDFKGGGRMRHLARGPIRRMGIDSKSNAPSRRRAIVGLAASLEEAAA
jgi:hypothetical protein